MLVNDIAYTITTPFAVYDVTNKRKLFSTCCGDVPPDVAMLQVVQVYAVDDMIYIDVKRNGSDPAPLHNKESDGMKMKTYFIRFADATGEHEHTLKAGDAIKAITYVVNWCAWGQATILTVSEVTELENGYKCYTSIIP